MKITLDKLLGKEAFWNVVFWFTPFSADDLGTLAQSYVRGDSNVPAQVIVLIMLMALWVVAGLKLRIIWYEESFDKAGSYLVSQGRKVNVDDIPYLLVPLNESTRKALRQRRLDFVQGYYTRKKKDA